MDADDARKGVRNGEIMPLPAILASVGTVRRGTVVSVDLVSTPERRLRLRGVLVARDGRLSRVRVDARTSKVIDVRKR